MSDKSDRTVTVFTFRGQYSPGIALRWDGSKTTEDFLRTAKDRFRVRDIGYSAARFCGHCHAQMDGNYGLALVEPPPLGRNESWSPKDPYNPGTAFVVDTETGQVTVHDSKGAHTFELGELPA